MAETDPKIEAMRERVGNPHMPEAQKNESELMRRMGEAMPEVRFSVRTRTKRLRVPREMTVHHMMRYQGVRTSEERPKHFIVAVLEITGQEALALADQSRESYKTVAAKAAIERAAEDAAEEKAERSAARRVNAMRFARKTLAFAAAMVVAAFAAFILVSPAGAATTQVLVTEPPAETLFLGLDQIPSGPIVVSFITNDGFEVTMTVTAPVDAAQFLPMDFFMVAGPRGSIDLSHVPEPGTAAMMGIGLLGLGIFGRHRKPQIVALTA